MSQTLILSAVFILLLCWNISFAYSYKEKINNMVGMVISMTLGMIVGLSIGTLLAVLYPNSFFEITIISMLVGSIIGIIAGFPFSLIAIIDGLMSGIMGGMMGAMLGVMISFENHNQLLNVISLWTVGVFFLVYLLQYSEINKSSKLKSMLFHPLPYFVMVCLYLYSFHHYSLHPNNTTNHHGAHDHDHEIIIHADEYQFHPKQVQLSTNGEIKLTLLNHGQEEHDFHVKGVNYHLHALPGKTDSISVRFQQPGLYEVTCTLPGHKEAGMKATILVQ